MADSSDSIRVPVSGGGLRNSYLSLRGKLDFFPQEAVGGSTDDEAGHLLTLEVDGLSDPVETDINGPKERFRARSVWDRFFRATDAKEGDEVEIGRLGPTRFSVALADDRDRLDEEAGSSSSIETVPALRISYAHRLLQEIRDRGPISIERLFTQVDPETLFKSSRPHRAAESRAQHLALFASRLSLLENQANQFSLTETGRSYVDDMDPNDVWLVTRAQSTLLRRTFLDRYGKDGMLRGAADMLAVVGAIPPDSEVPGRETLGRALGKLAHAAGWQSPRTFQSQASRFLALLQDMDLVDDDDRLTSQGKEHLPSLDIPRPASISELLSDQAARAWIVRAGREGAYEDLAISHKVALIGWSELGGLRSGISRDELKELIRDRTGETRDPSVNQQAGQIYRFINEITVGDLIVLPLLSDSGHVAVGRIAGPYRFRAEDAFGPDARNTRNADWIAERLPYERFDPDLREAFGQQGTVSEIVRPDAARRLLAAAQGADALAVHLVLKWSVDQEPNTIELHREVAEGEKGAVWWRRVTKSSTTRGLANEWLEKLRDQLARGSQTFVFLHSRSSTWRTRLLDITADDDQIETDLVPSYYEPDTPHNLWVKLTDFEQIDPLELMRDYVLTRSGGPVTEGGLGNQTPLIVRKRSSSAPSSYFILSQKAEGSEYNDREGHRYEWTEQSAGAWKQLASSTGAHFIYYRPGEASDGTSQSYFGAGEIREISIEKADGGSRRFLGTINDYRAFDVPVPFADGPSRSAQTSIQPITHAQYDALMARGFPDDSTSESLTVDAVREAAKSRGIQLADAIYHQVVAALESGKHLILTGPPGTAKTTLAQAIGDAAQAAGQCDGYTLTTATADWTTFETIGGLTPSADNTLVFREGHFLRSIEKDQWLVIDELNRSNFDRAFGQLFTVLSGQPVVLPYNRAGHEVAPLALIPEGSSSPVDQADEIEIPNSWRIIATMNVFDKTLLFEMSFALMRRFAFVEVASPTNDVFAALIEQEASGDHLAADLAKQLLTVRDLKDLGPAVYMDIARYLGARRPLDAASDGELLYEAFYSYLLPQFEGIDGRQGEALYKRLKGLLETHALRERLRKTLNAVLGLDLQAPASAEEDEEIEDVETE